MTSDFSCDDTTTGNKALVYCTGRLKEETSNEPSLHAILHPGSWLPPGLSHYNLSPSLALIVVKIGMWRANLDITLACDYLRTFFLPSTAYLY